MFKLSIINECARCVLARRAIQALLQRRGAVRHAHVGGGRVRGDGHAAGAGGRHVLRAVPRVAPPR